MLDVHAPHEPIIGWKDFSLHLFTITVGLLIALSLEGAVEWFHHRHLVHEAEASLHEEIERNESSLKGNLDELHKEQADLQHAVSILRAFVKTGKMPKQGNMTIGYHIHSFDNLGWKTAQATGAAAYMPYETAQEFANIYVVQDELADAEHQAARDTIVSLGPFVSKDKDDNSDPEPAEARAVIEKIGVLQGQMLLVDSLMNSLDKSYKTFLAGHEKG